MMRAAALVLLLAACAVDLTPAGFKDFCERNPQHAACGAKSDAHSFMPVQGAGAAVMDCADLYAFALQIAVLRDLDANRAKVLARVKELNRDLAPARLAVLERELKRVWREGKRPEEAAMALYTQCMEQLGDMGAEG